MTCFLKWVYHYPDFASLMVGRVELAQISRGSTGHWFWTLRNLVDGERGLGSDLDLTVAMRVCEAHAAKIIQT